jgi:hypothetical protein
MEIKPGDVVYWVKNDRLYFGKVIRVKKITEKDREILVLDMDDEIDIDDYRPWTSKYYATLMKLEDVFGYRFEKYPEIPIHLHSHRPSVMAAAVYWLMAKSLKGKKRGEGDVTQWMLADEIGATEVSVRNAIMRLRREWRMKR